MRPEKNDDVFAPTFLYRHSGMRLPLPEKNAPTEKEIRQQSLYKRGINHSLFLIVIFFIVKTIKRSFSYIIF
jgi:hypothetical protein